VQTQAVELENWIIAIAAMDVTDFSAESAKHVLVMNLTDVRYIGRDDNKIVKAKNPMQLLIFICFSGSNLVNMQ